METRDFGQKQPIHIAIRSLIHDYPQDEGILKELIQNADDGGATSISFILDQRSGCSSKGPVSGWQEFSGPSLVVTNSEPFKDEDLQNIQRLSNSGKVRQIQQTGRYGRGFNAVYNLTDTPLLLTGGTVNLFDPCGFHVGSDKSGSAWDLENLDWGTDYPDALKMFEAGGFKGGTSYHNGTIFRFPLRQTLRGATDDDRITNECFQPETFRRLVSGLEKLADQIVLFLRNITSIKCYEIPPAGDTPIPLLEIDTINQEEVQFGRRKLADVLDQADDMEGVLDVIGGLEQGCFETIYEHHLSLQKPGKKESLSWLVCSGVYAGGEGGLVDLARNLNDSGNKAIPLGGAAVCLERNGKILPGIDGGVSCFLPLSGVLGGANLGFCINGSFDLDGSRTGLTKHKGGEYGATENRANWNVRLIDDAIRQAAANVFSNLEVHDSEAHSKFYRLFPDPETTFPAPFTDFVSGFYEEIAEKSVFQVSDGSRVPVSEIRWIPKNLDLQAALECESLPTPSPRFPWKLEKGFQKANVDLEKLEGESVAEAYGLEESVSWAPDEIPIESLKIRKQLEAVTRFLVDKEWCEWGMLPLALCEDGQLRNFPDVDVKRPLFIATDRQKKIFDWFPEWFLDSAFCERCRLKEVEATGFKEMTTVEVLELLNEMLLHPETGESCWDPSGEHSPNTEWLVNLYDELLEDPGLQAFDEIKSLLNECKIVPADDGELHEPGSEKSPLLVGSAQSSFAPLLESMGVRHFVLKRKDLLSKQLRRFQETTELLWSLTPVDLIDSLGARIERLNQTVGEWRTGDVAKRLLGFLGKGLDRTELKPDHINILRKLPLFRDLGGEWVALGPVAFLAGDFDLPQMELPISLLPGNEYKELLKFLGVESLTRIEFLEEQVIPILATLPDDSLVSLMRWVRDEWNHLVQEFGNEESLVSTFKEEACLISSSGKRCSPCELYHPEAQEIVGELLGSDAGFPCKEVYAKDEILWDRLFRQLGLATTPTAQNLVGFIEGQVTEIEEAQEITGKQKSCLSGVLGHVLSVWDLLADVEVIDRDGDLVEFADFLTQIAWVPPQELKVENGLYDPYEPSDLLYHTADLLFITQQPRAGSVGRFFPRSIREPSQEIRERLDVVRIPSPGLICEHLRNVVSKIGSKPISSRMVEPLRKLLAGIYRGLGEHYQSVSQKDDLDSMDELTAVCSQMAEVPCIFIPEEQRFRCPVDVYRHCSRGLYPIQVSYFTDEDLVESGLRILGRKDSPTPDGLASALVRLAENESNLSEDELNAATSCLQELRKLSEQSETRLEELDIRVPTRSGQLLPPGKVFVDDNRILAGQLALDGHRVVRSGVPRTIDGLYRLATLSQAQASPVGELSKSANPSLVQRCQSTEKLLRSRIFEEGLVRVLRDQDNFVNRHSFRWLEKIRVESYTSVVCQFDLKLSDGETLHLGKAPIDIVFDPAKSEGGTFLVTEEAIDVFYERFADELSKELEVWITNLSPLVAILQVDASRVHSKLDRLRVVTVDDSNCFDAQDATENVADILPEDDEFEDLENGQREAEEFDGEAATDYQADEELEAEDDPVSDDSELEDEEVQAPSRGSGSNSSSPSGQHGGGGGSTRHSGGSGSSSTRGRMLPGDEDKLKEAARVRKTARQQDGYWISRPKTEKQMREARERGDDQFDEDEDGENLAIGDAAVGWVLQYERAQGRKPMSMAHANPGYDVESRKGRVVDRYIEVKGIDGEWGRNGVPLSAIQFFRSHDPEEIEGTGDRPMGDKFWLYVVEHARDPKRVRIHMIQNPAAKASHFRFDHGWRDAGEEATEFEPLEPRKGMKLLKVLDEGGYEEGEITRVDDNNYLMVQFGGGGASTVVYDPTSHLLVE